MTTEIRRVHERAAHARESAALRQAVELFRHHGSRRRFELTAAAREKSHKAFLADFSAALRHAATLIERGEPLSPGMRTVVALHLRKSGEGRPVRPGPKSDLSGRNAVIILAIEVVCYCWLFPATRNPASKNLSAALIAKRALEIVGVHLTESAINGIWRSYVALDDRVSL